MLGSRRNLNRIGQKSCPWGCCQRYTNNKKQSKRAARKAEKRAWSKDWAV